MTCTPVLCVPAAVEGAPAPKEMPGWLAAPQVDARELSVAGADSAVAASAEADGSVNTVPLKLPPTDGEMDMARSELLLEAARVSICRH